jgi:toxin FitB
VIVITASASERFVVDSSGWIEYFGNGPKADSFAKYLERPDMLLISSIIVYEVYKKLLGEQRIYLAEQFLAQAFAFYDREIYLSAGLAAQAAKISLQHQLSMADAVIYATAQEHRAQLVTSDAHFGKLPGVILL